MGFLKSLGTFVLVVGFVVLSYGVGLDFALLSSWTLWAGVGLALLVLGAFLRWGGIAVQRRREGAH